MELAEISHHGAVNGVTGSCHELHIDSNNSILIDCGLFQGEEASPGGAGPEQLAIDFSLKNVRALVVTHVHIDHIGRIPYLLAAGFNGPIYCSRASAILLPEVLEDAIKIGFTRNRHLIGKFIKHIRALLVPLEYGQTQDIELDKSQGRLHIKLKPAGHILGSAYIECDLQPDQSAKKIKVVFSGDLGAPYAPLLPAPRSPYSCTQLVIESTYGDRNHEQRRHRQARLKEIVERAVQNRGVVLIPAFSIGRTQELLYELESIIHRNGEKKKGLNWKDMEIIVDSPLASEFTSKYQQLSQYWDAEARKKLDQGRHPLDFSQLLTINDHVTHLETVRYLKKTARPVIVISASGMCSGGRVVDYLKALLGDERTDILFTGFQAQGTPGRDIQDYGTGGYVLLDGRKYTIRAQVVTLEGYSAHADQTNLFNFVKRMRFKPEQIRLVHGEFSAKTALKKRLQEAYPEIDVMIPDK